MVRKRAPAQKGLSPEKKQKSNESVKEKKSASSNGSLTEDPKDEKVAKNKETEKKTDVTEQNKLPNIPEEKPMEIQETETTLVDDEKEVEQEFYDELPDAETFAKELSEKAKSYWEAIQKDYNDFTSWTCLLQTVTESEENLDAARGAYNCFLRYYPYCYGYWKKYADLEKKAGNLKEAEKVFQHGIQAIPVSVDLWVHYLNFTIQQNTEKKDGDKIIRKLFNEAIEAAGMEFRSNKLWDAYIAWEKSCGNLKNVTEIYDQLISMPTQQYLKNWQKFKKHLESHRPIDILPTEEYNRLIQRFDAIPPGMSNVEDPTVLTTNPPGVGDTKVGDIDEDEGELEDIEPKEQKNLEILRHKIIIERESVFKETAGEIKKRWQFEDAIKRPYFHVKPLEKAQIKNWKEYLDYELHEGGQKRISFLFERCMVACALYEEFWEKYLDYIEEKDIEQARHVFERACNIHLRKKFNIHLRWAVFEEKQKNLCKAAEILKNIDRNFPGMILINQRRTSLARRMGNNDELELIYETAITGSEKIEDKIFYLIKYSHSLAKFLKNKDKAREMLWKALSLGKKHKRIYFQLLDLELHYGDVETHHVHQLFEFAKHDKNLDEETQDLFAQRQVEFYEEYGDDIEKIIEVREDYEQSKRKRESIKRHMSDANELETSAKASKSDSNMSISNIPVPPTEPPTNSYYTQQQQNLTPWIQQQQQDQSASTNQYYDWSNYYYNQMNQQNS